MRQYTVDAFTSEPFAGNPAAVCVMDAWPSEALMKRIAAENNLSETAFIVPEGDAWRLRWFTPTVEVELCGHATLASAYVVLNHVALGSDSVRFETVSGPLSVTCEAGWYQMDFPTYELKDVPVTGAMQEAFGVRPLRAVLGLDLVCVLPTEADVRATDPADEALLALPGRMAHVTARGSGEVDCVSRCFGPRLGIHEDPVCGSAHCQIADFWARELGRDDVFAYEASARGGYLRCRLLGGGRIQIAGQAALFSSSELAV